MQSFAAATMLSEGQGPNCPLIQHRICLQLSAVSFQENYRPRNFLLIEMAGIASAVYGTSFFFIGAALGSIISSLMKDNVFPIIIGFFMIGIITLMLTLSDRRPQSVAIKPVDVS